MIALHAANDLLLVGAAKGIVHIPDHLDLAVIGLGTGTDEEDLGNGNGGDFLQLFGEVNRGVMALAAEEMAERELAHLCMGGIRQFLIAIAQRGTPQTGQTLDIALALRVIDEDALPRSSTKVPVSRIVCWFV